MIKFNGSILKTVNLIEPVSGENQTNR